MLDALNLRGMAQRTEQAYIHWVAKLALHYKVSPAKLDDQQVQQYLLYLQRDRQLTRSSVNQATSAFRFLYDKVLGRSADAFEIPLGKAPQKLPQILSRQELAALFAHAPNVKARTVLMVCYASGLRLSEVCHLRVANIDSHTDRMCIHVQQGKGGKDRYVPLSVDMLDQLRLYWHTLPGGQRGPWLFGAQSDVNQALDPCTAQRWYHAARSAAGITKQGGIHTLRHCYATHLLEVGVDLHSLSKWLGHRHVSTTSRYLHLAQPGLPEGAQRRPLALLSALPNAAAGASVGTRH
jgi:site-specific recombinase XerD